ncbi:MAG TPA: MFS transporter [Terriglobales bacterium]|jgi:fucose permease
MLVFGIVLAILGTVLGLPAMRERMRIDLSEQGTLFLLLYLGIFCASLIVGPLIDYVGNKANLVVSSAMVAAAMVWFALAHSFASAGGAAVLLGLGGGGLNTCGNALVSDIYGNDRGPMLNLLGIFFGVGALSVPLLAASIEGRFTIPQLFFFCAILAAATALGFALIAFPPPRASQAFSLRALISVAKYEGVLLLAFILFLESGNEACIGGWTSTYVNVTGYSPKLATLVLASYWGALMAGRMLAARILRAIGKSQLVLAAAVMSMAGCAMLLWTQSLGLLFAGTALIGLSYGPIFPTTLAIAGDRYSKQAGTVFGLLFSIALIGGMLLPWSVGQVSQHLSVRAGMIVPSLGAVAIVLLSAKVFLHDRNASVVKAGEAASL